MLWGKGCSGLVVVPGHAVYRGTERGHVYFGDHWAGAAGAAAGYRYDDEAPLYVEHIRQGIVRTSLNPDTLLLFSGGQTRLEAGPVSEALSYWNVAEQCGWFGCSEVARRTYLENYARDSFENLLFSIYRFVQLTDRTPESVVVVGLGFKRERYYLHAETIAAPVFHLNIPRFAFEYAAVNDLPEYVLAQGSRQSEARTFALFQSDPLGNGVEALLEKREKSRNPFHMQPGYEDAKQLLAQRRGLSLPG